MNCWLCEHFQRYDRSDEPTSCLGECRFKSFVGYQMGTTMENGGTEMSNIPNFPTVREGGLFWCANFQRSKEADIPPAPPLQDSEEEEKNCANQPTIPDEWIYFWNDPWNKKNLPGYVSDPKKGSSCWNCDSFQREGQAINYGTCRRTPPARFTSGMITSIQYYEEGYVSRIRRANCIWCSEWSRARHTVPDLLSYECTIRQLTGEAAIETPLTALTPATSKRKKADKTEKTE